MYEIDPLLDRRWPEFIQESPRASVFHTRGWLEALNRTYGYRPMALTSSGPHVPLRNAIVYCHVPSFVTGRRLVSLPFSDHCDPLVQSTEELLPLLAELERRAGAARCKYVELRPVSLTCLVQPHFQVSQQFVHHRLDLTRGSNEVFRHFHYDSLRRRIRRAEREGLEVREGTEREATATFYGLVVQTRRRHGLPPQPLAWYRNVVECLCDSARIYLAYRDNLAVGGIMTLRHNTTMYCKYCTSDARFHNLGTVPYLLWSVIRDALSSGFTELDMGRSDSNDSGLITFKNRWGAARSQLSYWRSPRDAPGPVSDAGMIGKLARTICSHLPNRCLIGLGTLLYPHMA